MIGRPFWSRDVSPRVIVWKWILRNSGAVAALMLATARGFAQPTPTPEWAPLPAPFLTPGGKATISAPSEPGTYWLHLRYEYTDAEGQPQTAITSHQFRVIEGHGFNTVPPCRVFDTRTGLPLYAGQRRVFEVGGSCGVPKDATSVAANLTVVSPTANGHLTVWPDGPQPGTSSLNYKAGAVRANNAILKLGPDGTVSVVATQASGQTHLVLDVVGYFDEPLPDAASNAPMLALLGVLALIAGLLIRARA